MSDTAAAAAIGAATRELRLPVVRTDATRLAEIAQRSKLSYLAFLAEVLSAEVDQRAERRRQRRITEARFPRMKRLSDFDLNAAPTVNPATAAQLVNELVEAADERRLSRIVARYGRLDLLCLDELGYVQLDNRGSELLFQILTEREEKASVALASNLPFSEWGTIIPDPRLVAAIVDRVTFNAHIVETGTDSYRLRTTKARTRRKPPGTSNRPHPPPLLGRDRRSTGPTTDASSSSAADQQAGAKTSEHAGPILVDKPR